MTGEQNSASACRPSLLNNQESNSFPREGFHSSMAVNFDDFDSIQSEGDRNAGGMIAPLSPDLLQIQYCNQAGFAIEQSSPSRRSQPSDSISLAKREGEFATRAVHMSSNHNNARIPNFLHPIDRSNSSRPLYDVESSLPDHDLSNFSMAEVFLSNESARRRSLEQNYESLGIALAEGGIDNVKPKPQEGHPPQIVIEELVAAVDPTPWSEIKRKIQKDEVRVLDGSVQQSAHPHHYNYYPYGRHQQLPIPECVATSKQRTLPPNRKLENKAEKSTMEQAIATAAAIASGQGVINSGTLLTSPSPKMRSSSQPVPGIGALKPEKSKLLSARPFQRQQGSYSHSQRSAAHTTNRASVIAAASRKSQYGFGGNHTVPSVPAPPPVTRQQEAIQLQAPTIPTLQRGHISQPNSGAAYERKKQRAKDARVKLNEAIERLSISIGLAGSQSKLRCELLSSRVAMTADRENSVQINSKHVDTTHREKTLQTCENCFALAEGSRKWERPSLVLTAANLIQELNSQCEALSREIVTLQERLEHSSTTLAAKENSVAKSAKKRSKRPTSHFPKRLRPSPQVDDNKHLRNPIKMSQDCERLIFGSAKDFLDPISMSRALCVSRTWRDLGVFSNSDAWFQLAVKRFGFYNVRQWTEKLEDWGGKVSSMSLYQSMNAANVMPHFKKKGVSLIGDAKIPGRVSGWVFIVERSNGETYRSVRTEPGISAPTNGSFQSRPVVELKILIQNTGMATQPVIIRNQKVCVDVSTRRTGGELNEIDWDDRFKKIVRTLDGKLIHGTTKPPQYDVNSDLCHLYLFDSVFIDVYINACGCSTTSKFQHRSNFTKLLVCLEGTTVPMVIPFLGEREDK